MGQITFEHSGCYGWAIYDSTDIDADNAKTYMSRRVCYQILGTKNFPPKFGIKDNMREKTEAAKQAKPFVLGKSG